MLASSTGSETDSAVKERYSAAAVAREAALCCPVDYDPQYLRIIPQEVLDVLPIAIAEDCIIHSNAVVMASVGRGSLVGAGSVVTRPVEEYSIVVGNPARLLRKRG